MGVQDLMTKAAVCRGRVNIRAARPPVSGHPASVDMTLGKDLGLLVCARMCFRRPSQNGGQIAATLRVHVWQNERSHFGSRQGQKQSKRLGGGLGCMPPKVLLSNVVRGSMAWPRGLTLPTAQGFYFEIVVGEIIIKSTRPCGRDPAVIRPPRHDGERAGARGLPQDKVATSWKPSWKNRGAVSAVQARMCTSVLIIIIMIMIILIILAMISHNITTAPRMRVADQGARQVRTDRRKTGTGEQGGKRARSSHWVSRLAKPMHNNPVRSSTKQTRKRGDVQLTLSFEAAIA